jgi:hypothetical protein
MTPRQRSHLAPLLILVAWQNAAHAEGQESAAAEVLFQDARKLLDQKDYVQACPKFAESFRLDPGTGTLLNLARCHALQGKTASAWAEFTEVVARAKREGQTDRAELAKHEAAVLGPQLSTLTIAVAPGVDRLPGFEVRRDDILVTGAVWGTPVPVDPGEHVVEARVPGKTPFRQVVPLQSNADKKTVTVPAFSESNTPSAATTTPSPTRERAASDAGSPRQKTVALIVGSAGVAGVALGGVFALNALSKKKSAQPYCDADGYCDQGSPGKQSLEDARTAGNMATVAFIAGGALLAGGATLFMLAPAPTPSGAGATASRGDSDSKIAVIPGASPTQIGVIVRGKL